MSDLEQRLADALTFGAEEAPTAVGLAGAARARARRRRRGRVGVVAVAVALCIGVPAVVVASQGPNDTGHHVPPNVASDSSGRSVPDGYRVESWRSVTMLVPASWGWGSLGDWCADGGALTPRVQRPDTVSDLVACHPQTTYGISFQAIDNGDDFEWPVVPQDPKSGYPDGAYVGGRGIGGVLVMVTAPTQAEGLDVLATMRAIGPEGDPNGCTTQRDREPTVDLPDGVMAVCRYDADGRLEQSELLTGTDADDAAAALDAAPQGQLDCKPSDAPPEIVVMRDPERTATIELDGACTAIEGLHEGRIATGDVLYWALSPGWTGDATGLPLPSQLRKR